MSLPPWIALAQIAGILTADAVGPPSGWLRVAVVVLAALGPLAWRGAAGRAGVAVVLAALAGALSIGARLEAAGRHAPTAVREGIVDAAPCGRPKSGTGLLLCDARFVPDDPAASAPEPLPERILVSAPPHGEEAAALARVAGAARIRARLRVPPVVGARNPGARDRRRSLGRRGIGARGFLEDPRLVVEVESAAGPLVAPADLAEGSLGVGRAHIARRLIASGRGGALLAALAVGDRSGLERPVREAFAALGIAHVLAVSGLHVALVAGLGFALFRRLLVGPLTRAGVADPRPWAAAAAWGAALAYAGIAGMGVPLQRALIVAAAFVAAFASGRRWPPLHVLGLAASLVLALDPAALFDAGPQLSFAAVAALMLAPARAPLPVSPSRTARLVGALRTSLHTSALALAATAPVLALHQMALGVWGLLANAIAVPLTGLLLLPAALGAAGIAASGEAALAGHALAGLAWPAEIFVAAALALARLLPATSPPYGAGAFALIVAAAMTIAAIRTTSETRRVGLVIALVLWLRAATPPLVEPAPPRLVALDVGQGDALLVQGRRAAILVDAGRAVPGRLDMGAGVVVPALGRLGVRHLDVVVASHADVDHRGGLESVLRRVPVRVLWLPAGGLADPGFASLRSVARERGVPVEEIGAGHAPRMVGDLVFEPLWPPAQRGHDAANDRSIVARIRVDGDSVLLTGDVGRTVERRLLESGAPVRARILKVAHHGSETSSDPALLAAVGAGVAVVSAGCGARSGLPRPLVLDRLARGGAHVTWTGRDGAVLIALGSARRPGIVRTWGQARRCLGDDTASP